MRRARTVVPLVAVALAVLSVVGLLGFSESLNPVDVLLGRGPLVAVPDVVGRTRPRAVADLTASGLRPRFVEEFSLTAPTGAVAATRPAAGTKVRSGGTVTVAISKGVNSAVVPAAVGKQVAEVLGPLRAAGITVRVRRVWNDAPVGQVLSQDPEPLTLVRGREVVTFRVSRGPRPRTVPDVVGLATPGAGFRIGEAGLLVGTVTPVDDAKVPAGAVAGTRPPVGTTVDKNTPVDLLVSAGAPAVAVPDLARQPSGAAVDALQAAGFRVVVESVLVAPGSPDLDVVVSQAPVAGTPLRPGQTVVVIVGAVPVPIVTTTTTTTNTTLPLQTLPPSSLPGEVPGG
ncbi:MAG: PASTA domain-containing protein [Actinomycetes bacterium]